MGLIIYVCKVYMLPILNDQLEKIRSYFDGLRKSHRVLTKDKRMVEKAIVNDREWQGELKNRVMLWRSLVDGQRDQMLKEREQRKRELDKRIGEQERQIALHRLYKQVTPQAIDDARVALEKKFAHDDAQQKFVKTIITALRKQ